MIKSLQNYNSNAVRLRAIQLSALNIAITRKGNACKFYIDTNCRLNVDITNGRSYHDIQYVCLHRVKGAVKFMLELRDPQYETVFNFIEFYDVPKSWTDLLTDGTEFIIINESC